MNTTLELMVDRLATPIGEMVIVADDKGRLRAVDWSDHEPRMLNFLTRRHKADGFSLVPVKNPHGLTDAISRYFAGDLAALDELSVETGGTQFQRTVWCALRKIPCGTTISYADLARLIGSPTAVRAVGLANGSNPVGVIVPCHRVIGANGSLTGYGGGLDRKRWLLDHESKSRGLYSAQGN